MTPASPSLRLYAGSALILGLAPLAGAQCPASELERLTPPHFRPGELFAWSLDLDGDRALVGTSHISDPSSLGAAFLLHRQGDRWLRSDVLAPSVPDDRRVFGHAAALILQHRQHAIDRLVVAHDAELLGQRTDVLQRPRGPQLLDELRLGEPGRIGTHAQRPAELLR